MQQIKDELNNLSRERDKLDRFLSRFLEQFEMKMDHEEPNSPYFKLYKDKISERAKLSESIKSLEFRMKKGVKYGFC